MDLPAEDPQLFHAPEIDSKKEKVMKNIVVNTIIIYFNNIIIMHRRM